MGGRLGGSWATAGKGSGAQRAEAFFSAVFAVYLSASLAWAWRVPPARHQGPAPAPAARSLLVSRPSPPGEHVAAGRQPSGPGLPSQTTQGALRAGGGRRSSRDAGPAGAAPASSSPRLLAARPLWFLTAGGWVQGWGELAASSVASPCLASESAGNLILCRCSARPGATGSSCVLTASQACRPWACAGAPPTPEHDSRIARTAQRRLHLFCCEAGTRQGEPANKGRGRGRGV